MHFAIKIYFIYNYNDIRYVKQSTYNILYAAHRINGINIIKIIK